jgi:hypothetical protein
MDCAFASVDCGPTAVGSMLGEGGMVGLGCGWSLTACGCGCSGSASEEDPYASIPGGRRLEDTSSGAPSSSSMDPKSRSEPGCVTMFFAGGGPGTLCWGPMSAAGVDNGWIC